MKIIQYHYNPQAYLKGFSREDGGLFRYSKVNRRFEPEEGGSYKSYGSKRHLYLETHEKEYFQKIDDNFNNARRKFEKYALTGDGSALSQTDFNSLVEFISSQPFRTPVSRGLLEEAYDIYPPPQGALNKEGLRAKFGDMIRQKAIEISPKISNSILKIFTTTDKDPFITSDNVASLFRQTNKPFSGYTKAYLDSDTYMLFPMSSRLCLFAGGVNKSPAEVEIYQEEASPKLVKESNSIIYGHSTEYSYCNSQEHLEAAIKHGSRIPKCTS